MLADLAITYLDATPAEKQDILETSQDLVPRLDKVSKLLARRLEVLRLSAEIGNKTRKSLNSRQREVLLREQMAAIQKELGDEGSNKQELADLEKAIAAAECRRKSSRSRARSCVGCSAPPRRRANTA